MLRNKTEFDRKNTCFYVKLKTFQTTYVFHMLIIERNFLNEKIGLII